MHLRLLVAIVDAFHFQVAEDDVIQATGENTEEDGQSATSPIAQRLVAVLLPRLRAALHAKVSSME